ncbi:Na+ dependent nucleoside transporter N-terminal domain-containing protein, partial [Bacillus paranthracis]|uniref:Na+ dependent nucleoside transporter N-terminal domain-containing protein n=1 Tax=Bacillus paranthracis TaxID=2026186 RepID=UPI002E1E92D0|nr:Na+ dependent nucleoside transporter N-terminal domain-containing protein [Bacillus paranthracis]
MGAFLYTNNKPQGVVDMYFILNMLGIFVVILIVFLCSPNKKHIKWRPIVILII